MITHNRSDYKIGVIRRKPLTYEHSDRVYSTDKYVFGINPKYDHNRKKYSNIKGKLYGVFNKSIGIPNRCLFFVIFIWRNWNIIKK